MELLIGLIIAAGLGFIPAEIAKKKGRIVSQRPVLVNGAFFHARRGGFP